MSRASAARSASSPSNCRSLGVVAQVGAGVEEGEGAERAAAGDQRRHRGRLVAGVFDQLAVLVALDDRARSRSGAVRSRQTIGRPARSTWATGCSPRGSSGARLRISSSTAAAVGVGRADDAVADPAVAADEVDHAELGQLGDRGRDDRARGRGRSRARRRGSRVAATRNSCAWRRRFSSPRPPTAVLFAPGKFTDPSYSRGSVRGRVRRRHRRERARRARPRHRDRREPGSCRRLPCGQSPSPRLR